MITHDERGCAFPGCDRPVAARAGAVGQLPRYCQDPDHTAARAWQERQKAKRRGTRTPPRSATDLDQPVTFAAARAGELRRDVTELGDRLIDRLTALVGELRTLSDPNAAAAEVTARLAHAEQQVSTAKARAAAAEAA
ncbi:MAG TPA: hypothetical protein VIS06_14770, partial [Mycobacteriales bacterium]